MVFVSFRNNYLNIFLQVFLFLLAFLNFVFSIFFSIFVNLSILITVVTSQISFSFLSFCQNFVFVNFSQFLISKFLECHYDFITAFAAILYICSKILKLFRILCYYVHTFHINFLQNS